MRQQGLKWDNCGEVGEDEGMGAAVTRRKLAGGGPAEALTMGGDVPEQNHKAASKADLRNPGLGKKS
jgi:hypothetical protein